MLKNSKFAKLSLQNGKKCQSVKVSLQKFNIEI